MLSWGVLHVVLGFIHDHDTQTWDFMAQVHLNLHQFCHFRFFFVFFVFLFFFHLFISSQPVFCFLGENLVSAKDTLWLSNMFCPKCSVINHLISDEKRHGSELCDADKYTHLFLHFLYARVLNLSWTRVYDVITVFRAKLATFLSVCMKKLLFGWPSGCLLLIGWMFRWTLLLYMGVYERSGLTVVSFNWWRGYFILITTKTTYFARDVYVFENSSLNTLYCFFMVHLFKSNCCLVSTHVSWKGYISFWVTQGTVCALICLSSCSGWNEDSISQMHVHT